MTKYLILALSLIVVAGCENKPLIECQTNNDQLENEINLLGEKLADSLQVIETVDAKAKSKIDQLNKEIAAGKKNQDDLKDAMAKLKAELNGKLSNANLMFKKLEEKAKSDLAEATKKCVDLTESLKKSEEQQTATKQDLDQTTKKLTETDNKLNAAQSKVDELTKQVEVLQKEKAELLQKLSEKQKPVTEQK